MKKFIFTLFINAQVLSLWSQSIVLSPNSIETKHTTYENINLKGTATPSIVGYKHTGTLTSPGNTADGNILLSLEGRGYGGGTFTGMNGGLRFSATQNWNANNQGTRADIFTTENNSTLTLSRFMINQNGKVGIGNYLISNPTHQLEVLQNANDDKGIGVFRYEGEAPSFFGVGALGSILLPFATQEGNILARFGGKGHNGIEYSTAKARIDMVAIENWTATESGTEMRFFTTPVDQAEITQSLTLRGNGNLGIGETVPTSKLVINGDYQLNKVKTFDASETTINALNRGGASVVYVDCSDYYNDPGCARDPGVGNTHYNVTIAGIEAAETGTILHIVVSGYEDGHPTVTIDGNASTACSGCKIYTNSGGGDGNFNLGAFQSATFIYLKPRNNYVGWHLLNKSN
ncbi:MAG: hypothetical protein ACRCVT_04520 [Leadbetterella sp.]